MAKQAGAQAERPSLGALRGRRQDLRLIAGGGEIAAGEVASLF